METENKITTYKGFDKNMKCRDFQFEIGKEFETEKAKACEYGFHACENPIDIFSYYDPANSIFAEVEQSGVLSKHEDDSKVSSTKIKIKAEINIRGLIKATFDYIKSKTTSSKLGEDFSALTGGYRSALTGGYSSALTGGDRSVIYGCGIDAKCKGGLHSILAFAEFDENYNIKKIHAKVVDGKKIKIDTFYILKNGKITESK